MTEALDRDVRVAVHRRFIDEGIPPTATSVAAELGITPEEALASFERLAERHVITLLPGSPYIWMSNPFSGVPTDFVVRSGDKRWWGNCIWDALGILAALELDGSVSTYCPDCGDALEVTVAGGAVSGDGLAHFSVPAARWWDDIGHT